MNSKLIAIAAMIIVPSFSFADCPMFNGKIYCASYDFTLPVSITNSTTQPSLTVMGGNVGIGTLTPFSPLSVNGIIESTTGGFKFPDGSIQLTASTGGGGGSSIGEILPAGIQVGNQSFTSSATGSSNIAFGLGSLQSLTTGSYNIGIGNNALSGVTTILRNVAIGDGALKNVTSGGWNVAIGDSALANATNVSSTVAIGASAGENNSAAGLNVYIGAYAGRETTGGEVVAVGASAARFNTTGKVVAVGRQAASGNSTGEVIAIGALAAAGSTTGQVIAIGRSAAYFNGSGIENIAIGNSALLNSNGNQNIAIGKYAGIALTSASGNILIGVNNDPPFAKLTGTSSNNIVIGNNLDIATYEGSNILAIGNAIYGTDADSSSPVANAKIGIGTKTPGSLLDVAGTLRVEKICDRTGANCKTLASGWSFASSSNPDLLAKLGNLQKQNVELKNNIDMLKAQNNALEKRLAYIESMLSSKKIARK